MKEDRRKGNKTRLAQAGGKDYSDKNKGKRTSPSGKERDRERGIGRGGRRF